MTLALRCKGSPSCTSIALASAAAIAYWAPVVYLVYQSERDFAAEKSLIKIVTIQVLFPFFAWIFGITRPWLIVLVSGVCVCTTHLLWALSRVSEMFAFLEFFDSVTTSGNLIDLSANRSRIAIIILKLTTESIWMYTFILFGFVCNVFSTHCGFDWIFVGALAGIFVAVFETPGGSSLMEWFLQFISTLIFTTCAGIMTGTYFALTMAKILDRMFIVCIVFVPWLSLVTCLTIRYMMGFWGNIVVPIAVGLFTILMLAPIYRVRDD